MIYDIISLCFKLFGWVGSWFWLQENFYILDRNGLLHSGFSCNHVFFSAFFLCWALLLRVRNEVLSQAFRLFLRQQSLPNRSCNFRKRRSTHPHRAGRHWVLGVFCGIRMAQEQIGLLLNKCYFENLCIIIRVQWRHSVDTITYCN